MAQYGELYFAEKEEDINVSKYLMKLPDNLRNKIIKWTLNMTNEVKITWGVEGGKVQLPMTYSMYRKMSPKVRKDLFAKIEKQLLQRNVTHVTLPKLIKDQAFETLQECTSHYIKPFFIMEAISFMVQEQIIAKKLQHTEVIILDGNKRDVDMMIDFIYPYINHLTIISKVPQRFQEKADCIFRDVGLNMQVLSYTKGAISQGDIIIDTHYEDPLMIRFCKKGALYLDLANHPEKTVILKQRKKEVLIKEEFLLIKDQVIVSSKKAEMLLTMNRTFHRDYRETMKRLKKHNIEIYKLV